MGRERGGHEMRSIEFAECYTARALDVDCNMNDLLVPECHTTT